MNKRLRIAVLQRDGYRCVYCGASAADSRLHVDHFIPRRLGGRDVPGNLLTACQDCNLGKSGTLHRAPEAAAEVLEPGRCVGHQCGRRPEEFMRGMRANGSEVLLPACQDHALVLSALDSVSTIELGYGW